MKSLLAALAAFCVMLAGPALAGTTIGADRLSDAMPLAPATAVPFGDLPSFGDGAAAAMISVFEPGAEAHPPLAAFVRPSGLPEPSTWAAMLAGFGIAGASLRRGRTYRLVERTPTGETLSEEFPAPDDVAALERALSVADSGMIELWRGAELVQRFEARPLAHA